MEILRASGWLDLIVKLVVTRFRTTRAFTIGMIAFSGLLAALVTNDVTLFVDPVHRDRQPLLRLRRRGRGGVAAVFLGKSRPMKVNEVELPPRNGYAGVSRARSASRWCCSKSHG